MIDAIRRIFPPELKSATRSLLTVLIFLHSFFCTNTHDGGPSATTVNAGKGSQHLALRETCEQHGKHGVSKTGTMATFVQHANSRLTGLRRRTPAIQQDHFFHKTCTRSQPRERPEPTDICNTSFRQPQAPPVPPVIQLLELLRTTD